MSAPTTALRTSRRIARESVLWIGGALGSLCLLALALGWALHVTPLVFASGSMTPTYQVGALGIAREVPADDLRAGDVVSVVNAEGIRVTHRVIAVRHADGRALLTLRGDANNVPDAQTYDVTSAERVVFGVPYAGYVLNAAASPYGVAVTAAAVTALLLLGFGGSGSATGGTPDAVTARTRRHVRRLVPLGVASALVAGGVAGMSGAAPWAFTSAYWTDSASATTAASVGGDSTAPVLSNPVPGDGSSAGTWGALACSASANQICVSAADEAGGSGVSTVTVKLVRTSGTTQCWNGSAFVNGTGCAAQPMTLASGSQYRTSGLLAASMTQGTYQATFSATDGAANSATLTTTFGVVAAPVISACASNGNGNSNGYHLTWTWSGTGNPDSFKLYYGGGGSFRSPSTFAGTLRQGDTPAINNESGTFRLTAVINGIESPMSNTLNYAGQGSGKTCS